MSRPIKTGLEYFPLDVDMDQDDKLFFIEAFQFLIGRLQTNIFCHTNHSRHIVSIPYR